MPSSLRWLFPLCTASFLWAFSFGAGAPLASLWMQDAGCTDTWIGLNTGCYYLGIVVASGFVPHLLRRWGLGCLLLGLVLSGFSVCLFPWSDSLFVWFGLRAVNGVASALTLIPLEICINHRSGSEHRAQNFGYYAFSIAMGMALGTLAGMELYPSFPRAAFLLGGILSLLGATVVLGYRHAFVIVSEQQTTRTPLSFMRNFLSFGSAWSQGFLEGGMVGLLPLYLLSVGLSQNTASWLMSGLMVGVILAQVPVAWLADRMGRSLVLVGCHVVVIVGLSALLFSAGTTWLALWLFVVGACSGAFYPQGLALLGDRLPAAALTRANASYLALNSTGSLVGPALCGVAMDWFGRGAFFVVGGGMIGLVFITWLILELAYRLFGSKPISEADCEVNKPLIKEPELCELS